VTPNEVFLLFVAGMLGVYVADLFPRARFIRFAAIGAVVPAVYLAPSYPIRLAGLVCLLAAAGLFAVDFWSKINYVAGSLAIILLPVGFVLLYSGPQRINTQLAIWLGLMLSSATATLCWNSKRARLNKVADL
jgi:predicted tellurium resistance membrane protein TerC